MFQTATPLRISARWPPNISDEHVSCTAPATRNASLQILFKSHMHASVIETATKPQILLTFGRVQNPLRLPHKTTLQRPKVVRTCVFSMFTSKCASRQSGVHFFNISISTSKSAPTLVCFVHFDFERCFAPQRRALFQQLNFQKCSEPPQFLTLLTSKCASRHKGLYFFNISTSKSAPNLWCLTSESASRHSGVEFFISHLPRWRRTRRFSEPTFRPSWAPKHWKRKRNVSRLCYLFAHLHLLSSDSFSSSLHLCFSILLFHLPTL